MTRENAKDDELIKNEFPFQMYDSIIHLVHKKPIEYLICICKSNSESILIIQNYSKISNCYNISIFITCKYYA